MPRREKVAAAAAAAAVIETLERRAMLSTYTSIVVFTPGTPPDPPEASVVITSPTRSQRFTGGSVVKFAGRATHQGGADFPAAALDWTVELHDASGTATVVQTGGIGGSFVIPRDSSLTADAAYEITLRVTGSDNRTVEVSQTVHPQVVHVKLSSNWDRADAFLDGEQVDLGSTATLPVIANTAHELRFSGGGEWGDSAYQFKSARKSGAGSIARLGTIPSGPVFALKTKTKDLKIAARYTSRPAPAAGSASGGSDGVIVRYTYYGSGSDLSDLYRDTPRPPVQRTLSTAARPNSKMTCCVSQVIEHQDARR